MLWLETVTPALALVNSFSFLNFKIGAYLHGQGSVACKETCKIYQKEYLVKKEAATRKWLDEKPQVLTSVWVKSSWQGIKVSNTFPPVVTTCLHQ